MTNIEKEVREAAEHIMIARTHGQPWVENFLRDFASRIKEAGRWAGRNEACDYLKKEIDEHGGDNTLWLLERVSRARSPSKDVCHTL